MLVYGSIRVVANATCFS